MGRAIRGRGLAAERKAMAEVSEQQDIDEGVARVASTVEVPVSYTHLTLPTKRIV